jgi:hypothetical protein
MSSSTSPVAVPQQDRSAAYVERIITECRTVTDNEIEKLECRFRSFIVHDAMSLVRQLLTLPARDQKSLVHVFIGRLKSLIWDFVHVCRKMNTV